MNDFFINKIRQLKSRIPHTEADPLGKLKEVLGDRQWRLSLRPVTPDEISKIIINLTNSKSSSALGL